MKVLMLIESYLPGLAGGGPVRAAVNLVEHLGDGVEFRVLTRDHDYLDPQPYSDVEPGRWHASGKGRVLYASDSAWPKSFQAQVAEWKPDWIYLNGLFGPMSRWALRHRLADCRYLLAPHGNLGPGALSRGYLKKMIWLQIANRLGWLKGLRWHAASEREMTQVLKHVRPPREIVTVPMAPAQPLAEWSTQGKANTRESGTINLVYFGRVAPEKNLGFAIRLLTQFAREHPEQQIVYDLFTLDSAKDLLENDGQALPPNLSLRPQPALSHDMLQPRLRAGAYDAMLMPSLTENFSYTVLEAMQAGIAPLISDQTPWRDLQSKGIGWDLPLDAPGPWLAALGELARQPHEAYLSRCHRIVDYAQDFVSNYPSQARALFE